MIKGSGFEIFDSKINKQTYKQLKKRNGKKNCNRSVAGFHYLDKMVVECLDEKFWFER